MNSKNHGSLSCYLVASCTLKQAAVLQGENYNIVLWVSGGNNFILDLISVVLVYNQIEHIAAKEPWGMVAVCT